MKNCIKVLSSVLIFSIVISACNKSNNCITEKERYYIDSLVRSTSSNEIALNNLYNSFVAKNNQLGCIVTLKEIGRIQRNESKFEDALKTHSKGLHLAEDLNDTLEIIQALNNIGTDFRRLGILESATPQHYRAWKLSESYSDTSYSAKKNYVVSLNGLGNIYLTTGNYEKAEEVLRKALDGEQELKSSLGQAINYANLGSIFSHRKQYDSAWVYYRNSMKYNTEAKSTLGIALCHNYFGSLYEKQGRYSNAIEEYTKSRAIMEKSKDEWHTLNAILSLIRVYIKMGEYDLAFNNLSLANNIATKIKSIEHRADILNCYYLIYKNKGEWRKALEYNERTNILKDSLIDVSKLNKIQNLSIAIEREQQERIANDALTQYTAERKYRISIFLILGSIVLFLIGLAIILFNATRIRQRNIKLLHQLGKMRENFFINITHEIRTPLTIIMGLSHDIGKSEDIPQKTREMGEIIERHGKNLLTLINQLLDIAKIKSAQGNSDWRHGSITTYTSMIIEGYRDYAHKKNIDLQYIANHNIDMDFVPDYINKIINNLLSNALKFTPKGGKIIVRIESDNNNAFISVSDTGCGIPQESIDTIFEPFVQAENNNKKFGSGVGLALVKQIVKSLEGTITVNSTLNEGSTFIVKVPMKHGSEKLRSLDNEVINDSILIPDETDSTLENIKPKNESLEDENRVRLLIIEDNNDIARYIGSQLCDKYDISYANNGKRGLENARDIMPDLIITDLMMPEMSGLEVCNEVRKDEFISHIPIIIITAKTI
jgi:Signal transduction histidine kinase